MAAPEVRLDTPEHISQVYEYYRTPPDRERTVRVYERMNRLWVPRQTWEYGAMEAVRDIAESGDLLTVIKPHDSNHNPFQDAAAGFQIPVLHDIIASSGFHIIAKENWYKYRWFVKLVYSCLKGNDYTYKIIVKTIGKKTEQEATKEMDRLKKDASHTHPEASDYTLEDVRLSAELVDSHNNLLRW